MGYLCIQVLLKSQLSKSHHVWRDDSLTVLAVDVFHERSFQNIHGLWCETWSAQLAVRWHTTAATKLSCTYSREHHQVLCCYLHSFFITWSDKTHVYTYITLQLNSEFNLSQKYRAVTVELLLHTAANFVALGYRWH